ncbi:carbon starvation protein A [Pseudonocardia sp. KRD-184]|uniref:Carbon starvation protein A n=1 Tax=Pseudonocardia oceani TaxID=2792013 RepID=A0ABS6U594_9PSEU|nr:carbon starvation protein A [Pseudonocardia oceani]MBW0090047.1 carbon starvation protein A [Pseudonocardia oceani]MBW0095291.1 carbon starvation protein A [Pseudonocardia oceani]MBW0111422.1 carbon starvation protein A [Pseudonocardia oceani]MBW0121793.1 carbon starvation protein A [Pseudonocardia oceani]MBW0127407.1 carbon starvation protein A [Pseudonocardia oceani]
MPAIVVALTVLALFAVGYRYYSSYLARKVFALDDSLPTPAHAFRDGVDFLPTNRHVLFGHHFTSVAGAAPIVGPSIAVFWGWGPALAWVVLGTIFAAGVHDFGSIVVSVRHRAKSVGTLASEVINKRARTLFLLIIFFLLTLVNAVFAVVIGNLFVANPGAVLPILLEIPLAIGIGQYIYRKRTPALVPSIIGVVVLYLTIPLGQLLPISVAPLAEVLGVEQERNIWVVLLFLYTFVAARLPVWLLLQPRDYINSHQLFIALAIILLGIGVGMNQIVAPVLNDTPEGSPNWFPFLFITIACGAISGFHSLVASGTTSKQLDRDTDARYVGYMGAVGEGSLALGAILACTAGVAATQVEWNALYIDFSTASGGATGNFVGGIAAFAGNLGIPIALGTIFAAVVVISFAATTMDTGVRLQRYIVQEIAEVAGASRLARNATAATTVAVVVPLAMALLPGGGEAGYTFGVLWQLFGTTNQLTAGLALAVIAVWVTGRGRNATAVLVPLVFLLVMTSWALIINLVTFVRAGQWVLAPLDLVIFVLAVWLMVEATMALLAARRSAAGQPAAGSRPDVGSDDR